MVHDFSPLFGHVCYSYLVTSECGGPLCRFLSNILSVFLLHALLVLYLGVQVFQCDIKKLQLCNGWKARHVFFSTFTFCWALQKRSISLFKLMEVIAAGKSAVNLRSLNSCQQTPLPLFLSRFIIPLY